MVAGSQKPEAGSKSGEPVRNVSPGGIPIPPKAGKFVRYIFKHLVFKLEVRRFIAECGLGSSECRIINFMASALICVIILRKSARNFEAKRI
jgi:hypothetical protein